MKIIKRGATFYETPVQLAGFLSSIFGPKLRLSQRKNQINIRSGRSTIDVPQSRLDYWGTALGRRVTSLVAPPEGSDGEWKGGRSSGRKQIRDNDQATRPKGPNREVSVGINGWRGIFIRGEKLGDVEGKKSRWEGVSARLCRMTGNGFRFGA